MSGAFLRIWKICVLALATSMTGACLSEPPPLGYYGAHYDEFPTPGTPRTPLQIYRRLLEDGYETFSPPRQEGAVYFVGVYNRRGQPGCMILHAFSGVILQAFRYGRDDRLIAMIHHTPGPGFPGDPPFPDGRYATYCPPSPTQGSAGAHKTVSASY